MTASSIDIAGPLFLSYRQNDGTSTVASLARLLRAAGIPVWRDKDDLPPGDTAGRLSQAIQAGLSGAVFVVTPDIVNSDVVKGIEAPALITLHEEDQRFQLLIANDVATVDGAGLDYGAPDRLLGRVKGELQKVHQVPASPDGLFGLVQKALSHRMVQHRETVAAAGYFSLTIQTRNVAQVFDRTGAQLDIRVRRSHHEKLPDAEGLNYLRRTISLLPDAVTSTGATKVRIGGGAHLTVALALGAALPSSRIGQLEVVDHRSDVWASDTEAAIPASPFLEFEQVEHEIVLDRAARPIVAVYVDLLPTRSDAAFERYLDEYGTTIAAHGVIRSPERGLVDPNRAGVVAAEAVGLIRQLSAAHTNAQIDLMLATPFGLAVLIGRLCNTLRIRAFEWDDSDDSVGLNGDARPRYLPSLSVHASVPTGPITAVLLGS